MDNFEFENEEVEANIQTEAGATLPVKTGFWEKFKSFWLTPITVELTSRQQKIEDDINNFLHQEVTFKSVHDFFFQEIKF